MQTWSGPNTDGVSVPARKHIIIILSVFSLVGLVIGFAVGGLTHPKDNTTGTTNPTQKPTIPVQVTATATATATPAPDIILGPPTFTSYSLTETTGSSQYTVTIQAMDKKKQAVHAADITCKLWLVLPIPANQILNFDSQALKNVNNLSSPIQGTISGQPQPVTEIQGVLGFDTATNQTTTCDANGQFTWKYTIAATIPPGKYDLVVLTDWKGKHYNWSWADITIK